MTSQRHKQPTIKDILHKVIFPDDELIIIHSSLNAFGVPGHQLVPQLMEAFKHFIADGKTLLFPAFTLSFCSTQYFHHTNTPSETGILAELCRTHLSAERTPHPIFSFMVTGPLNPVIQQIKVNSAWGKGTIFDFCQQVDARIVLLGSDWDQVTQYHLYEQRAKVPYRHHKRFTGIANYGAGEEKTMCSFYVRTQNQFPLNTFQPALKLLKSRNAISQLNYLDGMVSSVSENDFGRAATDILHNDPWGLTLNPKKISS